VARSAIVVRPAAQGIAGAADADPGSQKLGTIASSWPISCGSTSCSDGVGYAPLCRGGPQSAGL